MEGAMASSTVVCPTPEVCGVSFHREGSADLTSCRQRGKLGVGSVQAGSVPHVSLPAAALNRPVVSEYEPKEGDTGMYTGTISDHHGPAKVIYRRYNGKLTILAHTGETIVCRPESFVVDAPYEEVKVGDYGTYHGSLTNRHGPVKVVHRAYTGQLSVLSTDGHVFLCRPESFMRNE